MRKFRNSPPGKLLFLQWILLLLICSGVNAQVTFPVNGVADPKVKSYAFTNATIIKDGQTTLTNATLVIRDGKIVAAGTGVTVPKDAVVLVLISEQEDENEMRHQLKSAAEIVFAKMWDNDEDEVWNEYV